MIAVASKGWSWCYGDVDVDIDVDGSSGMAIWMRM
jgi:hypothetical protein